MTLKEIVYPGLGIDFIVYERCAPGATPLTNGLDLPAEDFHAGDIRGQFAAFQLMSAAEKLPRDEWVGWFEDVLHTAVEATKEPPECSRRGAAVGMLYILDQMLAAFARSGGWRSVMVEQMAIYQRGLVEEHENAMADIDEFVASMMPPPFTSQRAAAIKARRKSPSKPTRQVVGVAA